MSWLLLPFALIYRFIIWIRNKLFDWKVIPSKSYSFPIISIGNITVGGTGKTPHIEFMVNWLHNKFSLVVLSRGYKRKTKGYKEVLLSMPATETGDEPLQIKHKFPDIRVVVDEDRVHAVDNLESEDTPPEVILLDDAFQHRKIVPGIHILLMDYNRLITHDHMLPMGRLREPAHNMDRATILMVTKCPTNLKPIDFRLIQKELNPYPFQNLFFTTFEYMDLVPVFPNLKQSSFPLAQLSGKHILLVTGIANSKPVVQLLTEHGATLTPIHFPDHHSFTAGDLHSITQKFLEIKSKNCLIVCTEKDAVRFRTHQTSNDISHLPIYYLPIQVKFLNEGEETFKAIITKFIGRFYEVT